MIGFHIGALMVEEVAVVLLFSLVVGQQFLQMEGRLEQSQYQ